MGVRPAENPTQLQGHLAVWKERQKLGVMTVGNPTKLQGHQAAWHQIKTWCQDSRKSDTTPGTSDCLEKDRKELGVRTIGNLT